jgi:type IV secretory pathway VirJ component
MNAVGRKESRMQTKNTGSSRQGRLDQGLRRLGRWGAAAMILASVVFGGPLAAPAADQADSPSVAGLPVIELPAPGSTSDVLVLLLSGDGGWADLDKTFGETFQKKGLSTVGFDCLKYFWKTRQPDEVSQTIETVMRHYLHAWNKKRVVFAGFSFGACWLPFLVNRLPADLLARIEFCVLLGPSDFVNVEIHVMDWMGDERRPGALEVLPEALKIGKPLLCVYGTEEEDAVCPRLKGGNVTVLPMPGDHHYNYHYDPVIAAIFKKIAAPEPQASR